MLDTYKKLKKYQLLLSEAGFMVWQDLGEAGFMVFFWWEKYPFLAELNPSS